MNSTEIAKEEDRSYAWAFYADLDEGHFWVLYDTESWESTACVFKSGTGFIASVRSDDVWDLLGNGFPSLERAQVMVETWLKSHRDMWCGPIGVDADEIHDVLRARRTDTPSRSKELSEDPSVILCFAEDGACVGVEVLGFKDRSAGQLRSLLLRLKVPYDIVAEVSLVVSNLEA